MKYPLRGGSLIIGSLYWQDYLKEEGDDIRKNWRNSNLNMNSVIDVPVAIRYGRFSGSEKKKNQTYTMVFDSKLPVMNYGIGKVVPFTKNIDTITELLEKAKSMSYAEGMGDDYLIKGSTAWCVCGISFNPEFNAKHKEEILENWKSAMLENKNGYSEFLKNSNNYGLSQYGEFLFDFPGEASELDLLIAMATKPKNRAGVMNLTITEISRFVSNRNYFFRNIESGISTFQDNDVIDYLKLQPKK